MGIDLGVKTGLAFYARDGRLLAVLSRNLGHRGRLRQAARGLLAPFDRLEWIVAEGDPNLAKAWFSARPQAANRLLSAEIWRPAFFIPRQRSSGARAKSEAEKLARDVMRDAGLPVPARLTDDAAEAVLIGLWAVTDLGWREG
ncbi:MAG: hypothetical protein AB7S38_28540 [Vulcanimicrobiota bacterium]